MREKPLRVGHFPRFSWKQRAILFSSVFAGAWVFLEPLFALSGESSLLSSLGLWGYAGLIGVSALSVLCVETLNRRRHLGTLDLVNIEILLTNSGKRLSVEAPRDLLAGQLVDMFLEKAARLAAIPPLISSMHSLYDTNLLVERNGTYQQVSNRKTLREAGLVDGDVCKIRGYIRKEHRALVADVLAPAREARIMKERGEGKVFLDEDVAVDLDEAVAKQIITSARARELAAGSPPGARFFVVDNSSDELEQ